MGACKADLFRERVKELMEQKLIYYDPKSGKAYWKERDIKWFGDKTRAIERIHTAWNSRNAGKEITLLNGYGYTLPVS